MPIGTIGPGCRVAVRLCASSRVSTQSSEFHSILQREGVDRLIMALNRKVDLLTRNVAKSGITHPLQ